MANVGFQAMKRGLYDYYCSVCDSKHETRLSFDDFFDEVTKYKDRADKYLVYIGYSRKDKNREKVIYVGTTIQYPLSRWYYHKTHKKDLVFEEYCRFDNEKDMLDKEYELIQKFKPSCNKITDRKQNYNVELTQEVLDSRKGDPEWCQCCLRRHVNKGYRVCFYCSNFDF